jgi:hypothetical protein
MYFLCVTINFSENFQTNQASVRKKKVVEGLKYLMNLYSLDGFDFASRKIRRAKIIEENNTVT